MTVIFFSKIPHFLKPSVTGAQFNETASICHNLYALVNDDLDEQWLMLELSDASLSCICGPIQEEVICQRFHHSCTIT